MGVEGVSYESIIVFELRCKIHFDERDRNSYATMDDVAATANRLYPPQCDFCIDLCTISDWRGPKRKQQFSTPATS